MSNSKVLGQNRARGGGSSNYQRQMGSSSLTRVTAGNDPESEAALARRAEYKRKKQLEGEALDVKFQFLNWDFKTQGGKARRGWVLNMISTSVQVTTDDSSIACEKSALDLYCFDPDGSNFKTTVVFSPYFYLLPALLSNNTVQSDDDQNSANYHSSIISNLQRKYEPMGLQQVVVLYRQDLDMVNHLAPTCKGRLAFKLLFHTVQQLMDVRRDIQPIIQRNKARAESSLHSFQTNMERTKDSNADVLSSLVDIREYDVSYVNRVCIDLNIRAGTWYTITPTPDHSVRLTDSNNTKRAEPSVLAFDIECTKAPLKFPDATVDEIFMISYMVNGLGYLIISRSVVSQDIDNFEYTPKPHFPGPFVIFNERNEEALIRRFFAHYVELKPHIVVTYNGDFFDWPYLEARAKQYKLDVYCEIGVQKEGEEYRGRTSVHLDAFKWVQRDSYLPQGSQGLKAVTKYKLGYDPVEVDPEDMVRYAKEKPVKMATYSVSDAVATYYLYDTYVHMFIFSLCTIIPANPEDVLRKGSGTLCEALLMVEAYTKNIFCPNKHVDPLVSFHNGHVLESETYIGGKVECLETGVYRSDIEYEFDMVSTAFEKLMINIDRDLQFAIEVEGGKKMEDIMNYEDVKTDIIEKLAELRDRPKRSEKPFVYHLDVGAMYPNIILTNRLQPNAMVDDETCAACDYNQAANNCKRVMQWVWRGEYNPATKSEYDRTKDQLSREACDGKLFHELNLDEQSGLVLTRLKQYARNAYKKTKITEEEVKSSTVCMRENDMYVATVLRFRDRRNELKKLTKDAKADIKSAKDAGQRKDAEDRALVYDSLQVAHKCILNSFYGYVMRKGARWRSMEMAGIVTKTGADLITQARILVEQIGRPLELDTDGIWCILPNSFPNVFTFQIRGGQTMKLEYPGTMLNADVHANFTNHQYQSLDKNLGSYNTRSECSIFFEVDGPYRCMVIPSSTEEGKLLKKRYAVFNHDGSLAELKGFELKRRGELELIKAFQSQVFNRFLDGSTLIQCYNSVAEVANHWLDVLDTQGESLDTEELFGLISENRSMSRQLDDYGNHKGTAQTCAKRLAEFLGAEIVKDKGLNCKFIIAERPHGTPVTDRAVPTAIWKSEQAVMKHYLRKWLKSPEMEDFDIRTILDWEYYKTRLSKTIQKIITIPAALQGVPNPVPRIPHPEWLCKTVRRKNDRFQQQSITSMFQSVKTNKSALKGDSSVLGNQLDIEDTISGRKTSSGKPVVHSRRKMTLDPFISEKESHLAIEGAATTAPLSGSVAVITPPRVKLSSETFSAWLSRKKQLWRAARRDRKDERRKRGSETLVSSVSDPDSTFAKKQRRPNGSVTEFLREAALAIHNEEWQVIEIRESASSSGEFIVWFMVNGKNLQRVQLNVPRVAYVNCRRELPNISSYKEMSVKKVERHLPHGKQAIHLYEVAMSQWYFRKHQWEGHLLNGLDKDEHRVVEGIYESTTPLIFQVLVELGCVSRVASFAEKKGDKIATDASFSLHELVRVDKPSLEYLHCNLSYRRIFLYEGLTPKSKTGIVALFVLAGGSGDRVTSNDQLVDLTRPRKLSAGCLELNASCYVWCVKPGSSSKGQRAITTKQCEQIFSQLVSQIVAMSRQDDASDEDYQYSCISQDSRCTFNQLGFVDNDSTGFAQLNDVLTSYLQEKHGPTFLLTNSSTKPLALLRKAVPNCNEFPVIPLPKLPGGSSSLLPALNWEPVAIQNCFEAYLHMNAVSFPKRANYARFGSIPVGNLGEDENIVLYDVFLARQLRKSRSLLWSSVAQGVPDFGVGLAEAGEIPVESADELAISMWGGEEAISPVLRNPGSYRTLCAEIDVHDLAIAALTDSTLSVGSQVGSFVANEDDGTYATAGMALGDEMSCAMPFQLLRAVAAAWLREANENNSVVADELLHHLYRLVCTPESCLHDPALHRVLHASMRGLFYKLLGELQHLGGTIISAAFGRIVIATNKTDILAAQEYTKFIISTIKKRGGGQEGLGRIALSPTKYWSHYIFIDEHNFGGIHYQLREPETDDESQWAFEIEDETVVPTVVSSWNVMHYLASDIQQEYFSAIVARFSRDPWRKEVILRAKSRSAEAVDQLEEYRSMDAQLLQYRKKMLSHHFASDLTRMVAEIIKDGGDSQSFPILPGSHLCLTNPSLEFIKNIMQVLRLDATVELEVNILNKSLLSQIGIQEYDQVTQWQNPCVGFILPDVFCASCHESRDLNLCVLPPTEDGEPNLKELSCEECGRPYDTQKMEWRLVKHAQRTSVQYQLQDLRCTKTQSVAKTCLSKQSACSAPYKVEIPRKDIQQQLVTLRNLAEFYDLDWLLETTTNLITNFVE